MKELWKLSRGMSVEINEVTKIIRHFTLFNELDEEALSDIAKNVVLESFYPNEIIIHQDDLGDKIYFILEGSAEAYTFNKDGKEVSLQMLEQGDYFGEIALLVNGKRTCYVRSISQSELISLSKNEFNRVLANYPSVSYALNHVLSQRLGNSLKIFTGKKSNTIILIYCDDSSHDALIKFENYFKKICTHKFYFLDDTASHDSFTKLNNSVTGSYILIKSRNGENEFFKKQAARIVNMVKLDESQICLLPKSTDFQIEHTVRVILNKTIGIALSSGGIPGAAHLTILQKLHEKNIPIDYIVGSSAGALFGGCYAFGYSMDEIIEKLFREYKKSQFLIALKYFSYRFSGILSQRYLRHFIKSLIGDKQMEDAFIPFSAVASDLQTGHACILNSGSATDAILASCSAPIINVPVIHDDHLLVDGVATMPLPTSVLVDENIDIKIAVPIPQLDLSTTVSLHSKMLAVYLRSRSIMAENISKYSIGIADVVIKPKVENINMLDWHSFQKVLDAGSEAAEEAIPAIEHLLNNHSP